MSNVPANLKYSNDHEWCLLEGDTATIGITDFAQSQLGDIVFVDVPTVGETLAAGDVFGSIEAVKTVSDAFLPMGGEVLEFNEAVDADPALVNKDPYGEGWPNSSGSGGRKSPQARRGEALWRYSCRSHRFRSVRCGGGWYGRLPALPVQLQARMPMPVEAGANARASAGGTPVNAVAGVNAVCIASAGGHGAIAFTARSTRCKTHCATSDYLTNSIAMKFVTDEKLVIVGAAGMIGSNMAQTALMMGLTSNLCLYDVFSPEGVAEELRQSGFDEVNITATTNAAEAFKGAKYILSSGGAPRKQGMTREDLLKGNCEIAEQLGKDIRSYCPDVKHVVIIFNPADLTGLVTLLYSGLKPSQVTTLAGLDSTRLQSALAKKFGVPQYKVTGCATYGGHGEQMAVFGSAVKIDGKPLHDLIGTPALPAEEWEAIKTAVTKGGAKIIELRGRSSFQSPAYLSVEMIRSVMGGEKFRWPVGTYVQNEKYDHIMMAMDTVMDPTGCHYKMPAGTPEELAKLDASYAHLCKMRDELVTLGIVPAISEWNKINPNL